MEFWHQLPTFFIPLQGSLPKTGKDLYDHQLGHLANALIIDDYDAEVEVDKCTISAGSNFKFPHGALLSGSFVMHHIAKYVGSVDIQYDDIDIYFHNKSEAQSFLTMNNYDIYTGFNFTNPMCAYGYLNGHKVNLIYGVEYDSPSHLISRFDIRACSMALDPNTNMLYVVHGAIEDATRKRIVFNPVPRNVTIRRLTKYIKKSFDIDKYQSLFFVELARSNIYSAELELMTKEY